jgi:hypothetical protein
MRDDLFGLPAAQDDFFGKWPIFSQKYRNPNTVFKLDDRTAISELERLRHKHKYGYDSEGDEIPSLSYEPLLNNRES